MMRQSTPHKIDLRVSTDIRDKIAADADRSNTTKSEIVRRILNNHYSDAVQ